MSVVRKRDAMFIADETNRASAWRWMGMQTTILMARN
jgi:hypothetical protein